MGKAVPRSEKSKADYSSGMKVESKAKKSLVTSRVLKPFSSTCQFVLSCQPFIEDGVNSNTKYLLRWWIALLFLIPLMAFGLVKAIVRGQYLMPVVLIIVAVVLSLLMWRSMRQALRFFQDATPDRAVEHYRRTMPRAPNGEALAGYMCGLVLSLYGRYDEARKELSRVSWAKFPPMYDGYRTYVLSIMALLEKGDASKALDLALEARDLCSTSTILPGALTGKRSQDAHVLACQLLADSSKESVASELEKSVKALPAIARMIPLWSLAQYYHSIGQTQSADVHMATLRRLAPNCKPLVNSV